MSLDQYYEELTNDEADFILDIYNVIDRMVLNGRPVTLVGLGYELGVNPQELSDHLPTIIQILSDKNIAGIDQLTAQPEYVPMISDSTKPNTIPKIPPKTDIAKLSARNCSLISC